MRYYAARACITGAPTTRILGKMMRHASWVRAAELSRFQGHRRAITPRSRRMRSEVIIAQHDISITAGIARFMGRTARRFEARYIALARANTSQFGSKFPSAGQPGINAVTIQEHIVSS